MAKNANIFGAKQGYKWTEICILNFEDYIASLDLLTETHLVNVSKAAMELQMELTKLWEDIITSLFYSKKDPAQV